MRTRANDDADSLRWHRALARAGRVGFWFFFVKGLAWLAVPLGIWLVR